MKIRKILREAFKRRELIEKELGWKAYVFCIGFSGFLGMGFLGFFVGSAKFLNFYSLLISYIFTVGLCLVFYFKYAYDLALDRIKYKKENK